MDSRCALAAPLRVGDPRSRMAGTAGMDRRVPTGRKSPLTWIMIWQCTLIVLSSSPPCSTHYCAPGPVEIWTYMLYKFFEEEDARLAWEARGQGSAPPPTVAPPAPEYDLPQH